MCGCADCRLFPRDRQAQRVEEADDGHSCDVRLVSGDDDGEVIREYEGPEDLREGVAQYAEY